MRKDSFTIAYDRDQQINFFPYYTNSIMSKKLN